MTYIAIGDTLRKTIRRHDGTVEKEGTFDDIVFGLGGDFTYTSPLVRRFFSVGAFGEDFSDYVIRWPKFTSQWDEARPRNLSLKLANEEGTFNDYQLDRINLTKPVEIGFGHDRTWARFIGSDGRVQVHKPTAFVNTGVKAVGFQLALEHGHDDNEEHILFRSQYSNYHTGAMEVIKLDDNSLVVRSRSSDGVWQSLSTAEGNYTLRPQEFHHILAQVGTNHLAFWLDGTLVSSATKSGLTYEQFGDTQFYISELDELPLKIADFRVYTGKILNLFNAGTLAQGRRNIGSALEPNLWIDFQGSLRDITDNGYNAAQLGDGWYSNGPLGLEAARNTIFRGRVTEVEYKDSECTMNIVDRFHVLNEVIIGSDEFPVNILNAYPSVFALQILGRAGFGIIHGSGDYIDWDSYDDWHAVFVESNVRVSSKLTGQRPTEILKELARITNSAIYIDHGIEATKIKFSRLSIATEKDINYVDEDDFISNSVRVSLDDVINKQIMFSGYVPSSDYYSIIINHTSPVSITKYGLHEQVEESKVVWFVDSVSASNAAVEFILQSAEPPAFCEPDFALNGLRYSIGNTINIADDIMSLARNFRIVGKNVDMDKGMVGFTCRQTRIVSPFTLDQSRLDGTDTLT